MWLFRCRPVWGQGISSPQFACIPQSHRLWLHPGERASCGCCVRWRWGPHSPAGGRTRRPSAARTRHDGTRSAAASTALLLLTACGASESTEGREMGQSWKLAEGMEMKVCDGRGANIRGAHIPGFPTPFGGGHHRPHFIEEEMEIERIREGLGARKWGSLCSFQLLNQNGSSSGEKCPLLLLHTLISGKGRSRVHCTMPCSIYAPFWWMEPECIQVTPPPYCHIPPRMWTHSQARNWLISLAWY